MTRIQFQLDQLADYNYAPPTPPTAVDQIRADARLEQILATPRRLAAAGSTALPRRASSRQRTALRWGAVVGLSAASLAVSFLLPHSPGVAPAFATWLTDPSPLVGAELDEATAVCARALNRTNDSDATVVAERRGDWGWLSYNSSAGQANCLVRFLPDEAVVVLSQQLGSTESAVSSFSVGSVDTTDLLTQQWSWGVVEDAPALAADEIVQGVAAESRIDGEGTLVNVTGWVGSDVVGVVVHTAEGKDVTATIGDGRFVAWWPADAAEPALAEGDGPSGPCAVSPGVDPSDGQARAYDGKELSSGVCPQVVLGIDVGEKAPFGPVQSFTLTLTDGTTVEVQ